jgi:hypothetical protein
MFAGATQRSKAAHATRMAVEIRLGRGSGTHSTGDDVCKGGKKRICRLFRHSIDE